MSVPSELIGTTTDPGMGVGEGVLVGASGEGTGELLIVTNGVVVPGLHRCRSNGGVDLVVWSLFHPNIKNEITGCQEKDCKNWYDKCAHVSPDLLF